MKVGVIGSGSWGCALSQVLAEKGHEVSLWSYAEEESCRLAKDRENKKCLPGLVFHHHITCTANLRLAAENKDVLVLVTPSAAIRQTAMRMAPYVKDGAYVVCAAKGFVPETHALLTDAIADCITNAKVCVLSGPSHAEEVAKKMPTALVAAADVMEDAEFVQDLFMTGYLRVYTSVDMCGVEIGGALKNIIALCAGICDGLGLGDNAKAAIMTRGMTEIARLGTAMGAKISTFSGLSGMGDLIVTCTSMHSRNRRCGILLGQGKSVDEATQQVQMVVEGIYAAKEAYALAKQFGVNMPITEQAYGVLFLHAPVESTVNALMLRAKRHETDNGFVEKTE